MKKVNLILVFCLFISSMVSGQGTFTLTSKSLGGQATTTQEFNQHGCSGDNQSPELSWENAPSGTKSFAITMYDPDAPTGSGFWHWVVFDIPSNIKELKAGAGNVKSHLAPQEAIQSINDVGIMGYIGPCPPKGDGFHQYIITVYALDTEKLGLNENTGAALVGFNLWKHTLGKASIVFYYKR